MAFALVDCNNFYASCERLFRPDLMHTPIVVLSSNDGCVIARSNEAKFLGIPMGVPYFQIKSLCQRQRVAVFSSNFGLYGDLSRRVMSTIESQWPHLEVYSIDEAFLDLRSMPATQHENFLNNLQNIIFRHTGIPTSIGYGATKTLAKLANHLCKNVLKIPVFNLGMGGEWLQKIPVGDVWGIGSRWESKLTVRGIHTAWDLTQQDIPALRRDYNVVMAQTALELRGIPCHELQVVEPRKSIMSSKSFGQLQTQYEAVAAALSSHCARAVEKLREQGGIVRTLSVFVQTNRHRQDLPQHTQSKIVHLGQATDDIRIITAAAKNALKQIFRPGYFYQKTGICFAEVENKEERQLDLFLSFNEQEMQKTEQLMQILGKVNQRFGRHTLHLAAEGFNKPWDARLEMRSPCYTTQWSQLPRIINDT